MIKDFLRIIGAACILSGIFLYFSIGAGNNDTPENKHKALTEEIIKLRDQLQKTEEELAHLQTLSLDTASPVEEAENKQPIAFTLIIEHGTSSIDVANELKTAGMIDNADAFNTYLTSHDLAKNIQIGEYTIAAGMSTEEIAKQITTLME